MRAAPHPRTNTAPRAATAAIVVVVCACLAPPETLAFDDQLEAGIEGGYANLTRRGGENPPLALGGGGGIRLRYGLTDWLGVVFAGRMTWYGAYRPWYRTTVTDPEDPEAEPVPVVVRGPAIERIQVRSFAFSLMYAFDVMRVVPFFSLGVVSARISEEHGGASVVDHELGLRTDLGADYALLDQLSIGATIGADTFLTDRSGYVSQFDIVVRISFLWEVGIFGRGREAQ